MTFKEKIDKILSTNTLGINSVSALEDFVKAGRGAINDFYKDNREPGRKTLKKIKSLPGLNTEWYDTGKGEVFTGKSTYVDLLIEKKDPDYSRISEDNKATDELLLYLLNRLKKYEEKYGDNI